MRRPGEVHPIGAALRGRRAPRRSPWVAAWAAVWAGVFGLSAQSAAAQGAAWQGAACVALNNAVMTHVQAGDFLAAEAALSGFLAGSAGAADHGCAGVVLSNIAVALSISGRLPEAESYAQRSVHVLEQIYPPEDPVFLRPLHVVASSRILRGEIGRAREAFKRMRLLQIQRPEDSALFHGVSAALLCAEGRYPEAESEYAVALTAWEHAGRVGGADYGSTLNALAAVYVAEAHFDEARRTLDRALDVFSSAPNAVAMDRFKVLATRAVVYARLKDWRGAEQDLRDATAIADGQPGMDPMLVAQVLRNYAYVLRKNHRRDEARAIEARATGLPGPSGAVVDASELLAHAKASGK